MGYGIDLEDLLLASKIMKDEQKILHLNLYRKYFDEIAEGTKTIEYRDKTDYWKRRLENKEYDVIKFRNGYRKDAPIMLVEYVGLNVGNPFSYEIQLGKVLEVQYNDNR